MKTVYEKSAPLNTLRGSIIMCSHLGGGGGRGTFICGVCLEKISRESPIMHVFVKSNGYQLPRSRGYTFSTSLRGVQVMRNEQRSPVILRGGGGGGVRGYRNLDCNNSDSFDKHVSPLIAFSHWLLCFWCNFAIFDSRPCHCLMNVFSHAWISRS